MSALTILIIRHAEKPQESWPGPGFMPEAIADRKSLVIRGWQRAGGWCALFGAGLGGDFFPQPAAIYAADPGPPPASTQASVRSKRSRPWRPGCR